MQELRQLNDGRAPRTELRANVLEREVQSAITGYLSALGVQHSVTNAEESYNRKGQRVQRVREGWPDVTGCAGPDGKFLAIECKRAVGGKLEYEQADCLQRLYQSGALIVVARSVDDVADLLATGRVSRATIEEITKALTKGPDRKKIAKRLAVRAHRKRQRQQLSQLVVRRPV